MNKSLLALTLLLALGATSCRTHSDEPKTKPDTPQVKPEEPKQPEKPVQPEAQIVIEQGVLKSYPEAKVADDGAVSLDATVTEIGEGAFAGNTKIKTLVAPGLKKIAARAFAGATAFHLLDLSNYKASAGHDYPETAADAFVGTPADKALKLPANPSYTAWFEYLARHTFATIEGLKSTLPSGAVVKDGELQSLPRNYRAGSNGLLVLPETVTKLGEGFLNQDKSMGVKLVYGPAVTEIGNGAFSESNLTFAHFPRVTKIGMGAFNGLNSLKLLSLPELTEIGEISFLAPSVLNFLSLPKLKTIGKGSFAGSLTGVKTFVLGAMPTLDKTPYSKKTANDLPYEWAPFLTSDAVSFSGGRAAGAQLFVPASALTSYGVAEGATWEGFKLQTLK